MSELTGVEVIGVLKKKLPKAKFILVLEKIGKYLTSSQQEMPTKKKGDSAYSETW